MRRPIGATSVILGLKAFIAKPEKARVQWLTTLHFVEVGIFTCGEACKSRDDKKSVGGGAGVVVCPELLSKEEVELWFCPELLSKTLVNGKNDA